MKNTILITILALALLSTGAAINNNTSIQVQTVSQDTLDQLTALSQSFRDGAATNGELEFEFQQFGSTAGALYFQGRSEALSQAADAVDREIQTLESQ